MSAIATGPVTEEMRASLLARIAAMERLWDLATRDMALEHVNHFERPGVLPIAFTLVHALTGQDRSAAALFGGPVLWDAHAARVGLVGIMPKRGTPMAEAERVRIGDMDAWRSYQGDVFARTQRALLNGRPTSDPAGSSCAGGGRDPHDANT